MGAGALDVVATPILNAEGGEGGQELLNKIARIGKLVGIKDKPVKQIIAREEVAVKQQEGPSLIVIGCSTGGPQALLEVLKDLPAGFPGSVVVVQHMDEQFTGGLADWLNKQLDLSVRVMREGEFPEPGAVLIPSTNNHMIMHPNKSLGYAVEPKSNYYHPSADVFFASVAKYWRGQCVAVLLTGMGRDGAAGMSALHQLGHMTIAQDQKTSIVFGMPKAAIELGVVREILPLDLIGRRIKSLLN